jgi:hypothetical protein
VHRSRGSSYRAPCAHCPCHTRCSPRPEGAAVIPLRLQDSLVFDLHEHVVRDCAVDTGQRQVNRLVFFREVRLVEIVKLAIVCVLRLSGSLAFETGAALLHAVWFVVPDPLAVVLVLATLDLPVVHIVA